MTFTDRDMRAQIELTVDATGETEFIDIDALQADLINRYGVQPIYDITPLDFWSAVQRADRGQDALTAQQRIAAAKREERIAAIEGLAAWLRAHPEVPTPIYMVAHYWSDEIDHPTRAAEIRPLIEHEAFSSYPSAAVGRLDMRWQCDAELPAPDGMNVIYRAMYTPTVSGIA